jgi:uncharacterized RDD family membrane protein YckC
MPWFYAEAGQQKGPVSDDEFEQLVQQGAVQPSTFVWRDGMTKWETLASVRSGLKPPPVAPHTAAVTPAGHTICAECGKAVPTEETVQIGAVSVCPACKPTYVQKLREGAVPFVAAPAGPLRYAGFWIRAAAYMIDQLILGIVSMPLTIYFVVKMQQAIQGGRMDWASYLTNWGLSSACSVLVSLLYTWLLVGRYGATLGKMLLKLKIVTPDGAKISYLRALGRFGGYFVSSLPCMLGFLFPLWDAEKRALHDHMCHTRVIYK